MINLPWWMSLAAGILLIAGVLWTLRTGARKRLKRFADREILSDDEIYARFFSSSGLPKPLVSELWNEIAKPLGVHPGKLRPSDRFDTQLASVESWDDDIVEVQWAAGRRLKQSRVKADMSQIATVGDYVEFLGKLSTQEQRT